MRAQADWKATGADALTATALARKIKVADVFRMVASVRSKLTIPVVAMVSYSIVFRYGIEKFTADAKAAGFDGLILPDLPPPEAQKICTKVRAGGLDTILLIAPTTAPDRRKERSRFHFRRDFHQRPAEEFRSRPAAVPGGHLIDIEVPPVGSDDLASLHH